MRQLRSDLDSVTHPARLHFPAARANHNTTRRPVTWFKVDDSFHDHPKVFDAPDCAVALWTRAGTWAARNLTNGFVPSGMPARLCDDPDTAVRELVRRGLWKRASGGYRFHDWADFQPSADSVRTLRAKRAEAGRLGGQAKAAKQNASKSLANASHVAKQNAAPSRPPSLKGGEGRGVSAGTSQPGRCRKHSSQPEHNCRDCRSERLGGVDD